MSESTTKPDPIAGLGLLGALVGGFGGIAMARILEKSFHWPSTYPVGSVIPYTGPHPYTGEAVDLKLQILQAKAGGVNGWYLVVPVADVNTRPLAATFVYVNEEEICKAKAAFEAWEASRAKKVESTLVRIYAIVENEQGELVTTMANLLSLLLDERSTGFVQLDVEDGSRPGTLFGKEVVVEDFDWPSWTERVSQCLPGVREIGHPWRDRLAIEVHFDEFSDTMHFMQPQWVRHFSPTVQREELEEGFLGFVLGVPIVSKDLLASTNKPEPSS